MGILDFLTGADQLSTPQGFDIKREDFEIKDADKLFGQSQEQMEAAKARGQAIAPKRESFLNVMEQAAMGQGPSLAAEQLKQAQERNLAQQLAMAQAQRGGDPAALQRQLFRAQQAGAAETAQQAGQARLQESLASRQLYAQQLQAEQQAVDQLTQQYLNMGFDVRRAQQQALADYNRLQTQQALGLAQIQAEQDKQRMGARGQLIGGLVGGAATALAGPVGGLVSGLFKTSGAGGEGGGGGTSLASGLVNRRMP